MGYEVHITLADEHYASLNNPIELADWITYARTHPSLTEEGWVDWSDVGRVPVFAYTYGDGTMVSLAWFEGGIDIKGVRSTEAATQLLSLAQGLGANLISDEGERYTETGVIRS